MASNVENAGDLQAQIDEIEALSSIYGDDWCVIDEASRVFCIQVSDDVNRPKRTICLQIILPHDYPSAAPPTYQLNASWLRGPERAQLSNGLEDLYVENAGECILYLWVERIREFILERSQSTDSEDGPEARQTTEEDNDEEDDPTWDLLRCRSLELSLEGAQFSVEQQGDGEIPPIKHGEPITDRRSTFQGHVAHVVTPRQVRMVLDKLYENKKVASATHNIYAYRIYCEDKHAFLQDCEDDGETAAGGRLLHLLQILDVRNVMVVVSRWYGGILLGPDRFKHINNCARAILVREGYTEAVDESSRAGGRNKKQKTRRTK